MKWKTLAIIVILVIVTLPSINAQFQSLELNTKDETNKAPTGLPFEVVFFCCGKIKNLKEYGHGYCFYYTFNAIDVICLRSTEDHPRLFIHR